MYTFLFDRRSMVLLAACVAVLGALVFASGLLLGMKIERTQIAATKPPEPEPFVGLAAFEEGLVQGASQASDSGASAKTPADETAPAGDTAPKAASEPEAKPGESSAAPAQVSALPEAPREPAEPLSTIDIEPSPAPAVEAETVEAAPEPEPGDTPIVAYVVQVGAYSVAENAERQLEIVLSEGFEGDVSTVRTRSGSILSTVRFGTFATREAALDEARRYVAAAPGREALVRHAG